MNEGLYPAENTDYSCLPFLEVKKLNVNEVLERFRMAEYHYPDVIWHDLRSAKLKPKITTDLVSLTLAEF